MQILKRLIYPKARLSTPRLERQWRGRWVVITGASSGIGEALARRLMTVGANVFLVARSEKKLKALAAEAESLGCKAYYRALDLRDRTALDLFCKDIRQQLTSVDCLFSNAGKSICRSLADSVERCHDFDRTMDLNYRAPVVLSLALLPALKAARGNIVYTSSVSTLYPPAPGWAAYHASKEAANNWHATAMAEFAPYGIRVKRAYLPLVHTPMSDANEHYRRLPAYTPAEAADILLRLAQSRRPTYKPWWARLSAPVANMLKPLVTCFYIHASRKRP